MANSTCAPDSLGLTLGFISRLLSLKISPVSGVNTSASAARTWNCVVDENARMLSSTGIIHSIGELRSLVPRNPNGSVACTATDASLKKLKMSSVSLN